MGNERENTQESNQTEPRQRPTYRQTILTMAHQVRPNGFTQYGIDAHRWLVQYQQRWIIDQRYGQRDTPLLATRHGIGVAILKVLQVEQLAQEFDLTVHAPFLLLGKASIVFERLAYGELGDERQLLGHVANVRSGDAAVGRSCSKETEKETLKIKDLESVNQYFDSPPKQTPIITPFQKRY